MAASPELKRFIRDDLGCGCPDEVLERILVRKPGPSSSGVRVDCEVDVGGRLLIHVVNALRIPELEAHLAVLVAQGRKERDDRGFNRFRLVVLVEAAAQLKEVLDARFAGIEARDERTHLHIVTPNSFPGSLAA